MNLQKLTERAAHTLQCCKRLMADVGRDEHQRALAAALDALRKHPPTAPPVVVGLFNQCIAHGDGVIDAISRARTAPTLDVRDRLRRSLGRLQDSLDGLNSAATRRVGATGRRNYAAPRLALETLRRS